MYIFDAGNNYIRIVDPATKIMRTMIHGSCHVDYTTSIPKIRVPFELELKPMICFKKWIKVTGMPDEHMVELPSKIEILDPTAVVENYDFPDRDENGNLIN